MNKYKAFCFKIGNISFNCKEFKSFEHLTGKTANIYHHLQNIFLETKIKNPYYVFAKPIV
jgi:hypothetical protein